MKPAVFFDRDNTLILDKGYTYRTEDFIWLPGAEDALRYLHTLNIDCFIVTNQGGIGRGFFSEEQMHLFHQKLRRETERAGGKITDIAFCPHHPLAKVSELKTPCTCRKPEPGMLFALADKHFLDLRRSVMIGDRQTDIDAGEAAGCRTALSSPENNLFDVVRQALISAGLDP